MESHNKKSFKVKLNPHITIYNVEEMDIELQLRACRAELVVARNEIARLQNPVEEKMYTRLEMRDKLESYCRFLMNNHVPSNNELTIPRCNEWFEKNVK